MSSSSDMKKTEYGNLIFLTEYDGLMQTDQLLLYVNGVFNPDYAVRCVYEIQKPKSLSRKGKFACSPNYSGHARKFRARRRNHSYGVLKSRVLREALETSKHVPTKEGSANSHTGQAPGFWIGIEIRLHNLGLMDLKFRLDKWQSKKKMKTITKGLLL